MRKETIDRSLENSVLDMFMQAMYGRGYDVTPSHSIYGPHMYEYIARARQSDHMVLELIFFYEPMDKTMSITLCGKRDICSIAREFHFYMTNASENTEERFKKMLDAAIPYTDIVYAKEDRREF